MKIPAKAAFVPNAKANVSVCDGHLPTGPRSPLAQSERVGGNARRRPLSQEVALQPVDSLTRFRNKLRRA